MGWNVYVTRQIPEAGIEMLREACRVVDVNPEDRVLTHEELLAAVAGRVRTHPAVLGWLYGAGKRWKRF